MDIFQSLSGIQVGRITSARPEHTLKALTDGGILLLGAEWEDMLTCRIRIRRQDWKKARQLCEMLGADLKALEKHGIFWQLAALFHRPVLILGILTLLLLYLYLPTRILFVQVQGNHVIPTERILEAAEDSGIRFWARRRDIRSERVKNALLEELPLLQWAGVNTSGCVATISVREGSRDIAPPDALPNSAMVASRSGFLLSATATKGSLLVQPGQTVKEGQLLISGYEDCGICIRATGADGEIMAQTLHRLEAVTPQTWLRTGSVTAQKKKFSLILGKKRINLWKDSGISVGSCGRMYEEYYVTLPGGFRLPWALCVETFLYREERETVLSLEEASSRLRQFAQRSLAGKMIAGEILNRREAVTEENGCWHLTGTYVCREMIGRLRQGTDWRQEWERQQNGSSAPSGQKT